MSFGERLRKLRRENKLTLNELAQKLNLTPMTISRYERDIIEPSIETLKKISKLFNVSIDYLVENNISSDFVEVVLLSKKIMHLPKEYKEIILGFIEYCEEKNKQKKPKRTINILLSQENKFKKRKGV